MTKINDRIFIAGASGMVGSSIYRNLKNSGYGNKLHGGIIYTPTRKELNLLDYNQVLDWFSHNKPSVVIILEVSKSFSTNINIVIARKKTKITSTPNLGAA